MLKGFPEGFNHLRKVRIIRFVKAVELPTVVRFEAGLILPCFDELPKALYESWIQGLGNEHHIHVFRRAKRQFLRR
jgi:hypothetical protein